MIYQQCCHKFGTRMNRLLVAILTFVIFQPYTHCQVSNSQQSVSLLNAMWEAGYITSKIQTPWADFAKVELAFPKVETMKTDPNRQSLQQEYALKKAALKADKGISLEGVGQENFSPQMNEENLIYRTRASAGVEWNLLSGGFLDHQTSAKLLDQELLLKLQNLDNNGAKQISYGHRNHLIFYFNKKKLLILRKRKKLAESKINVLTPLASNREIPSTMLLDNYKQMIDIAGQYNLYGSFNESVANLIDSNKLNLPSILPPFDINVQALKNLCGVSTISVPSPTLVPRKKSLLIKEIKFSTHFRYNYFDLITSTTNRNFLTLGVNTSIPLRIFSKNYRNYHEYLQINPWNQKQTQNNLQWLEISNLIYEFKYKLKQFGAWEEKQRIQKESLRIYQGLHQINDASFHPIQALDALDTFYALELEKLDLLQQLYIKLGEIQVLLPQENVNRYIIPYQKQTQPDNWITEVDDSQFIYTRGVIQSNQTKKEQVQIVIRDASDKKVVGDVITTLPKGRFEVYFPKPGKYQYQVKLPNQAEVLTGEFEIPDSTEVPAFMNQNVKINKQKNGKFELSIENGMLDSIHIGISKAENDVSAIENIPNTINEVASKNESIEYQSNSKNLTSTTTERKENNLSNSNLKTLSDQPNNLNSEQRSLSQDTLISPKENSKEITQINSPTEDTLIGNQNILNPQNPIESEQKENGVLDTFNITDDTSKSITRINEESDSLVSTKNLPKNTKEAVDNNFNQNEKTNTEAKENTIVADDKNNTSNEIPFQNKLNNTTSSPPKEFDALSQKDSLQEDKIDSSISESINSLNLNNTPTDTKEKSTGSYSIDIRAAHVIQLVLDGLIINEKHPWNGYEFWKANQMISQNSSIVKEIKNKSEIDSLQQRIKKLMLQSNESNNIQNQIDPLNARLSALENENRNIYKSYTDQINKILKKEIDKNVPALLSNVENPINEILKLKISSLQEINDSLTNSAIALRISASNKKDLIQKNQLMRDAFDDEMKSQKVMQHLVMAIDAAGVFKLYNDDEILFLRKASDDQIKKEFRSSKTYLATTDAVVGEPYYVKSKSNDKNSTVEKDFFYTVQIGAFKSTFYIEQWEEWSTIIGEKIESGLTRVMIGKEATSEQAEISKRKLQSLGYADAFVVLYNNGERLPIRDILNITEKIDTTLLTSDRAKALQMMKDKENKMASWSRGIYVWSKAFVNVPAERIMDDFKQWKIDHVILSPTTDAKNWVKAQPLIDLLNQNDIAVEWMIGNNQWLGHSITGKLDSLNNQLQTWNIKTLHLDIEPHTLPDYKKNKEKYHRQYLELVDEANIFCKKNNLQLNLSIPLGLPEDVLQKIAELNVTTTLMAYENPSMDAVKRRSQEEVQFGQTKTIIALRAKDYQKSADMEKDLQLLKDWIPSHRIVIHDYNTYKQISSNEKR